MALTTERPSDESEGDVDVNDIYHANFQVYILKAYQTTNKDGQDVGRVEAIVSAFDVDYRMGFTIKHRVTPKAFDESIASNANVPLFWMHNWDWSEQPPIGTGKASTVTEPKPGLKIVGDFFLDTDAGRSTFRAIKAGALREWSIGYRIQDFSIIENDDGLRVVVINRADLWEASSVIRGANPATETLSVARHVPPELQKTLDALANFMELSTNKLDQLESRLTGIESAHDLLVGALDDADFTIAEGGSVEPAVGGGSDGVEPEATAPRTSPAPGSPEAAAATPTHHTKVEAGAWDADANMSRLMAPCSKDKAKQVSCGYRDDMVDDKGMVPHGAVYLPHHFVDANGDVGAASINGVDAAKARLNQVQGISDADRQTAEAHLNAHQADYRAQEPAPDRLDRAMDRAMARITLKWEDYLAQAGAGLDGDADQANRDDIDSMERVLRCMNRTKHNLDAFEHVAEARVLAERRPAIL